MSSTGICLPLSHSMLEDIALDASALAKALGMRLDKTTESKLRRQEVALPKVQGLRLLPIDIIDDIPFMIW